MHRTTQQQRPTTSPPRRPTPSSSYSTTSTSSSPTTTPSSLPSSTSPVVASLQGKLPHLYSSLTLSPFFSHPSHKKKNYRSQYAIAAGKDIIRLFQIDSHYGLREVRSLRVSQHFQNRGSPTAAAPPGTTAASAAVGVNKGGGWGSRNYGDVRDTFNLPKQQQQQSSPSTTASSPQQQSNSGDRRGAGGGGGGASTSAGVNVTITDVAWSLPQSGYIPPPPLASPPTREKSDGKQDEKDEEDENNKDDSFVYEDVILGKGNRSKEKKKMVQDDLNISYYGHGGNLNTSSTSTINSATTATPPPSEHPFTKYYQNSPLNSTTNILTDDSIVAAAGSNGAVVCWHARTALLGQDELLGGSSSSGNSQNSNLHSKAPHQQEKPFKWGFNFGLQQNPSPSNRGGGMVSTPPTANTARRAAATTAGTTGGAGAANQANLGQPEAVLFQHSRAVNRLAWHCTGRRPGLLLTASQDATVKLWDRRSSSASPSSPSAITNAVPSIAAMKSHPRSQQVFSNPANDKTTGGGGGGGWNWFGYASSSSKTPPTSAAAGSTPAAPPNPNNAFMNRNIRPSMHSSGGGTYGGGGGGNASGMAIPSSSSSWTCVNTFHPKCEAVRDIRWSPFHDDVFAMVTDSGYLVVYDIRVMVRPWIKIAAHSGEATTVDWHPTRKYIIATGGGRDRSVKVWDLENGLSLSKNDDNSQNAKANAFSNRSSSDHSDSGTLGTANDLTSVSSGDIGPISASPDDATVASGTTHRTIGQQGTIASSFGSQTYSRSYSNAQQFHSRSHKKSAAINLHSLSISAPVTRLKWRPPARHFAFIPPLRSTRGDGEEQFIAPIDRHDAMLAVSTAPISGANAGGVGSVGLWSYHRPFMPLSVVEGHTEGAVMDFAWIDTPPTEVGSGTGEGVDVGDRGDGGGGGKAMSILEVSNEQSHTMTGKTARSELRSKPTLIEMDDGAADLFTTRTGFPTTRSGSNNSIHSMNATREKGHQANISSSEHGPRRRQTQEEWVNLSSTSGTWQHVLTVGRDGRCLLQSLARGERPISQVPPSTFAMANLSPFQKGYGSLQITSVHQKVPSGQANDYSLTGLRRDAGTSHAPGIFKEFPPPPEKGIGGKFLWKPEAGGQREPANMPMLEFYMTDHGDIEDLSSKKYSPKTIIGIAPEVVHLSRFASSYRLHRDTFFPTKASLCLHNATVADDLQCKTLSRMWRLVASIVEGSCLEKSEISKDQSFPTNAMSFLLFPTLKSLLIQRADAGDVQTCVAICEVMEVILPPSSPKSKTNQRGTRAPTKDASQETLIPGLELELVREWYLSYIELLQQMCLFSDATNLIRSCRDPVIGALNQQSTTIHEACPCCKKPLQGVAAYSTDEKNETQLPLAQRACKSCRRRIGLCWICHEPVKGVFVWCPGCGHGGHLDHALEWFGGPGEKSSRESCPTGCGHKCNLLQTLSSFPKTESFLRCMPTSDSES